jgi:hypothetical protein
MKVLVTGSSGHLGEALVRTLRERNYDVVGVDIIDGPFTTHVGSITDRACVRRCMSDVQAVFHAATLHKPHVGTHGRQDFVDTNITGTLTLLEAAATTGVEAFVYTSTTSVFGDALVPPAGAPATWVTVEVTPIPKNIYGVTKAAAEELCQLFHRNNGLACIVLRTSRFFPEADDNKAVRDAYADDNIKANEFLSARPRRFHPMICRTCARTRHGRRPAAFPATRLSTRAAAGRWFRASTACMSTNGPATSLAGNRGMISSSSSIGCKRARMREVRSPASSGRRVTTPRRSPKGPIP